MTPPSTSTSSRTCSTPSARSSAGASPEAPRRSPAYLDTHADLMLQSGPNPSKEEGVRMKPESDYYVEVVIKPADGGLESFRAVMVTGTSPKTAEKRAIEDARQAHPEGMEFSTFMTRKVTAKKADEI